MIRVNKRFYDKEVKIILLFIIIYTVGAAGLAITTTRSLFISMMPFTLILTTVLMFWRHDSFTFRQVMIFVLIALLGLGIEMVGVWSGLIFGSYSYGYALGWKMAGTPLVIGLNWLMLIYAVYAILLRMGWRPLMAVPAGAFLMLLYDFIMEPVAMKLDMWDWQGGIIPLQNYIAWFIISAVMLAIFYISGIKYTNKTAPYLFFIHMGFFLFLNIFLRSL
jgi:bisanhydrobacterioruberin hydratase